MKNIYFYIESIYEIIYHRWLLITLLIQSTALVVLDECQFADVYVSSIETTARGEACEKYLFLYMRLFDNLKI